MTLSGHAIRAITFVFRLGVGVSFAVLIATVLIQVVGRTTGRSPVWTEELSRISLLYLVGFGTGLSLRSGDLVNVDVVCESLPGRWPWLLRIFSAAVTLAVAAFLLAPAWKFVSIGKMQTSPALAMRMDQAHFTVWLLLGGLALFAAIRVLGMLAGRDDGLPLKGEDV